MWEDEGHETKRLNECDIEGNKRERTKNTKQREGHVCEHTQCERWKTNTVSRTWKVVGGLMKVISSHIGAPLDRNLGGEVGEAPASVMNMIIGVRVRVTVMNSGCGIGKGIWVSESVEFQTGTPTGRRCATDRSECVCVFLVSTCVCVCACVDGFVPRKRVRDAVRPAVIYVKTNRAVPRCH